MDKKATAGKKSKFIQDKHFNAFTQPSMVEAAHNVLSTDADISEEAFLGAQAVLLINGIL